MRSAVRWLAAPALIVACMIMGASVVRPDSVAAQETGKPVVIKRIYTGTDGLSHVEEIPLHPKMLLEKVSGILVNVSQPGSFRDWHPGPQRQYVINVAGTAQYEVAEGIVDIQPGTMIFIDDITGKGHTTRVTSKEQRVSLWLNFENQKQHIGPLNAK